MQTNVVRFLRSGRRKQLASAKRALVAGGAGFLGSHLCERLLAERYDVVCLDNFHTGAAANLANLSNSGRLQVVGHDIVSPLPDLGRFDEIYNLACPASPRHYQADPISTLKTNVVGALNLLDLAVASNAKILQASTSEVYGDPHVHPQPESYLGNVDQTGPRACYDEGKRCAETLFLDYARRFGVDTRIARIFNTYGPRMRPDDGRVVSNFITQALRGEELTIYGDGCQTRSFCFVDDLIEGFIRLMRSELNAPVNLGNPHEITIGELARTVIDLTGSRSRIAYRALPVDDPRQRRPDIALAMSALGWRPKIALGDGLLRTTRYFAGQIGPRDTGRIPRPA